jgi:phosphoenolpyruvate-protein kinase (PTS system EI component)
LENKQVCICGETSAVRESIFLFVSMGADQKFIHSIHKTDAEKVLDNCLKMEDAKEIDEYLKEILMVSEARSSFCFFLNIGRAVMNTKGFYAYLSLTLSSTISTPMP